MIKVFGLYPPGLTVQGLSGPREKEGRRSTLPGESREGRVTGTKGIHGRAGEEAGEEARAVSG